MTRDKVMGFLQGQIAAGKTLDEAKNAVDSWLASNTDVSPRERELILDDLDSYKP